MKKIKIISIIITVFVIIIGVGFKVCSSCNKDKQITVENDIIAENDKVDVDKNEETPLIVEIPIEENNTQNDYIVSKIEEQESKPISSSKAKTESNKKGKGKAKIIGGNLSSILTILGTEYLPIEVFDNKILFLEDVNISMGEFDSFMQALRMRGTFKNIKGLIIGKFVEEDNNIVINDFLNEFFKEDEFPIMYNVDLGHTNPKITIPIGTTAEIECSENIRFRVEF